MNRLKFSCLSLLTPLLLAGCSSSTGPDGPPPPKTTQVGGTLMIDGEPAPRGLIELKLYPKKADLSPSTPVPKCLVGADGKYSFSSFRDGDGAEPGEYVLSVEWLNMAPGELFGPDKLGNNFNSPANTDARFQVSIGEEEAVEIPTIEIETKDLQFKQPHPFASPPGKRN